MNKKWYEGLFENYSKTYDQEVFTQGTIQEVDFIEKEIGFNRHTRILDIGCGTGRHSVELAKRGYSVTGIDLSDDQLKAAREKAVSKNVNVTFLKADARNFSLHEKSDLAILICEGAFPLMDTDEENYMILKNIASALEAGGKFFMTTLSALYPIFNNLKKFHDENMTHGYLAENSFDLITLRDRNHFNIPDDDGNPRDFDCNERYYMPSEISWMLKSLGFTEIEIFGCKTGAFGRVPLTPDDFEMMVISRKI